MSRLLEQDSFFRVGQTGSHVRFKRSDQRGTRLVIVPNHGELTVGTLKSILRQAGWSRDDLMRRL